MIYRLHRDGQNLGAFTLVELRRRRRSGELNGNEFVWGEGMPDWERLDVFLTRAIEPGPVTRPPQAPAGRPGALHPGVLAAIIAAACIIAAVVSYNAYRAFKIGKQAFVQAQTIRQRRGSGGQNAQQAATRPVLWGTNTLTESDSTRRDTAFYRRQWLTGYELRGDHSAACDTEALRFLRALYAASNGPTADFAKWAGTLEKDPSCTDPLLLLVLAFNATDFASKTNCLERAHAALANSKHDAFVKFTAAISLENQLVNKPARIAALDSEALASMKRAFSDGNLSPDDDEICAEFLVTGWARDFFKRNRQAVVSAARSAGIAHGWLAMVLDGEYHIREAWKARGDGTVNSVSAQGWQGFETHLAQARASLTVAWTLHPERAIAPARMIEVALGDSGIEEMRTWFDRTVQDQFDYPSAWSQMRWGLRPRWYGDPQSMLAFGVTAVNTGRFDTDVPRKFMDVVSDLEDEEGLPAGRHIYGRADIWPHFQQLYEGYVSHATGDESRNAWRTSYAMVAYLGGKYDVARDQFAAMNWKPSPENMKNWYVEPSLVPFEAAAWAGSMSEKVREAEVARTRRDLARAAAIYEEISSNSATDAHTSAFARSRLASLGLEQKLEAREWVDFLPQVDDANWVYSWGGALRTPRALQARSGPDGHLFYSLARVGKNFEVKGEFSVAGPPGQPFQAGLVMGMPDCSTNFGSYHWYAFRLQRTKEGNTFAIWSKGWSDSQGIRQAVDLAQEVNSFDFTLRGDACTATVNGRSIFLNSQVPQTVSTQPENFLLGVGGYGQATNSVIEYRSLQVRKLK